MPNYIRPKQSGATIFFTVNLAHPGMTLLTDHIDALRDAVAHTRRDQPFHIDAFVVLPDHLHAIWTLPPRDRDFSTRWKKIKAQFTRSVGSGRPRTLSQAAKGERGIWQRRFWEHHIRSPTDRTLHLQYCWSDPMRHGLCARVEDWPYSSLHRDNAAGLVDADTLRIPRAHSFGEQAA